MSLTKLARTCRLVWGRHGGVATRWASIQNPDVYTTYWHQCAGLCVLRVILVSVCQLHYHGYTCIVYRLVMEARFISDIHFSSTEMHYMIVVYIYLALPSGAIKLGFEHGTWI